MKTWNPLFVVSVLGLLAASFLLSAWFLAGLAAFVLLSAAVTS